MLRNLSQERTKQAKSAMADEETMKADSPNESSPRFSNDTKDGGRRPTAQHHSLPRPDMMSRGNTDDPGKLIPGAYPEEDNAETRGPFSANYRPTGDQPPGSSESSELPTNERPSGSRVGIGSLPRGNSNPNVADKDACKSLEDQNPSRHSQPQAGSRPGDTIFSATQRAKQRDSSLTHHTDPHVNDSATTSAVQRGQMARDTVGGMGESLGGVNHSAEGFIAAVEGAASGMYHGAEQILHDAEMADKDARKSLEDQNPSRHSQPQAGSRPGDTIFSATQRAKQRDSSLTHHTDPHVNDSATTSAVQRGQMARDTVGGMGESVVGANHSAEGFIAAVEGAASGMYHGAEQILHDAEVAAKSYVPASIGAYFGGEAKAYSDIGRDCSDTTKPSFTSKAESSDSGTHSASGPGTPSSDLPAMPLKAGAQRLAGAIHQAKGEQPASASIRTFGGQDSQIDPENIFQAVSKDEHDRDPEESFADMNISGAPTIVPAALQDHYYHSEEYDLDGEIFNTDEFIYEDDVSAESVFTSSEGEEEQDIINERAGADYKPGDDSSRKRPKRGEGDVEVGYGSVTYKAGSEGGVLPGYPTQEGVDKLVSERMRDDRLRAAGAHNPPTSSVDAKSANKPELYASSHSSSSKSSNPSKYVRAGTESTTSTQTLRGSYSELNSEFSNPDTSIENRNLEEVEEVPVIEGGGPTATGKDEPVIVPITSQPEEIRVPPVLRNQKPMAGKLAPTLDAVTGSPSPIVSKKSGVQAGYFGKPVGTLEEEEEVESTRKDNGEKFGIN